MPMSIKLLKLDVKQAVVGAGFKRRSHNTISFILKVSRVASEIAFHPLYGAERKFVRVKFSLKINLIANIAPPPASEERSVETWDAY